MLVIKLLWQNSYKKNWNQNLIKNKVYIRRNTSTKGSF